MGARGRWPHYRCTFLSEYAAKDKVNHPKSVYLREEQLLPHPDGWLSRKFDPIALASTVRELEEADQPDDTGADADADAQREIAECDAKLRQHRAALEAGADAVLVTGRIKETHTNAPRGRGSRRSASSGHDVVAGVVDHVVRAEGAGCVHLRVRHRLWLG